MCIDEALEKVYFHTPTTETCDASKLNLVAFVQILPKAYFCI